MPLFDLFLNQLRWNYTTAVDYGILKQQISCKDAFMAGVDVSEERGFGLDLFGT